MTENHPIRVLHVVPSMSLRAGMTSVVMNYHRAIDADKVHFDYLYINPPEERIAEAEALGARVWRVPFAPRPSGFAAVRRFFSQHAGEFDIVHCHQIFAPEMVGRPAKRFGAKRVVAHSHATRFSDKRLSGMRNRFISHFVGLFATDYMACSDAARVLLGRHGKDAYILHNAIDCARFAFDEEARSRVRSELGVSEKTLLLGTLGRLEEPAVPPGGRAGSGGQEHRLPARHCGDRKPSRPDRCQGEGSWRIRTGQAHWRPPRCAEALLCF